MRELVYLSERKLRQFLPERRRSWWQRAGVEGEVKLPLMGLKLSKAASAERPNQLDAVIDALERSSRAARWFTDEDLQPGQWAHFEAKLNYAAMGPKYFQSAVLFLDSGDSGHPRLLLHGSPEHLTTGAPPKVDVDAEVEKVHMVAGDHRSSSPSYLHRIAEQMAEFSAPPGVALQKTAEVLATQHDGLAEPDQLLATAPTRRLSRSAGRDFDASLDATIGLLDRQFVPATAAWMAGYARVTARIRLRGGGEAVVATPLYVEYVDAP